MAETRLSVLREIFKPWYVKVGSAIAAICAPIGGYSALQSQWPDSLPLLQNFAVMKYVAILPWWGWLLLLQAIFTYALFEYVRLNVPLAKSATADPAEQGPGPHALTRVLASTKPRMNFTPIKNREIWSVGALAEVAAALDPDAHDSPGTHKFSYKETILDAMRSGKLPYIKREVGIGRFAPPSGDSEIKRGIAIKWIKEQLGFDTSAVE